jgi:hypothetical protein
MMVKVLKRRGVLVNRNRVQRLMQLMGIRSLCPQPRTTTPNKARPVYPYLLRNMVINRPNQVRAVDITYVPFKKGFWYLVAIMDWHSRKVLTWRLSNTMTAGFCVAALHEALALYSSTEIFDSDQGSQFTSEDFTKVLKETEVAISMDGVTYITADRNPVIGNIGDDTVRPIYDHLRELGHVPRLDLYIYSRGGAIDVPWRLARAFRQVSDEWNILIPFRANSAATLLALGADNILLGPIGELGPIDPSIAISRMVTAPAFPVPTVPGR